MKALTILVLCAFLAISLLVLMGNIHTINTGAGLVIVITMANNILTFIILITYLLYREWRSKNG